MKINILHNGLTAVALMFLAFELQSPAFAQRYSFGDRKALRNVSSIYSRFTSGYTFYADPPRSRSTTWQSPSGWVIEYAQGRNDEGFGPSSCDVSVTQAGGTYFSSGGSNASDQFNINANANKRSIGVNSSQSNSQSKYIQLAASAITVEMTATAYQRRYYGTKANCKLDVTLVCTQDMCY